MLPYGKCFWCNGKGKIQHSTMSFINEILDLDEADTNFYSIYEAVEAMRKGLI